MRVVSISIPESLKDAKELGYEVFYHMFEIWPPDKDLPNVEVESDLVGQTLLERTFVPGYIIFFQGSVLLPTKTLPCFSSKCESKEQALQKIQQHVVDRLLQ